MCQTSHRKSISTIYVGSFSLLSMQVEWMSANDPGIAIDLARSLSRRSNPALRPADIIWLQNTIGQSGPPALLRPPTASARVLESPKPNVWLRSFGESAVQHEIRVWIRDPEAGVVTANELVIIQPRPTLTTVILTNLVRLLGRFAGWRALAGVTQREEPPQSHQAPA